MRTSKLLIWLISIVFVFVAVPIVTSVGSKAEVGGYWTKYFKKKRAQKHWEEPSRKGKDVGNHTLRWDTILDSSNGSTEAGSEGCHSDRFKCIFGGAAVLDKETGIVWEQSPDVELLDWDNAMRFACHNKVVGGRKGWRPPTVAELTSVVEPTASNPALPNGHPFRNVQSDFYWSASTRFVNTINAWRVNFADGEAETKAKSNNSHFVWCVRAGRGHDGVE